MTRFEDSHSEHRNNIYLSYSNHTMTYNSNEFWLDKEEENSLNNDQLKSIGSENLSNKCNTAYLFDQNNKYNKHNNFEKLRFESNKLVAFNRPNSFNKQSSNCYNSSEIDTSLNWRKSLQNSSVDSYFNSSINSSIISNLKDTKNTLFAFSKKKISSRKQKKASQKSMISKYGNHFEFDRTLSNIEKSNSELKLYKISNSILKSHRNLSNNLEHKIQSTISLIDGYFSWNMCKNILLLFILSIFISIQKITLVQAGSIDPIDTNFPLSSWMNYFSSNISSIPLTQLVIPGTHDSGSYSIKPNSNFILSLPDFMLGSKLLQPIMKWQQTQGNNLYEQLNMGVRYFDIRVMQYDNKFYACHSSVRGEQINDLLEQVSRFMKENPEEIVLFDIHQFLGFESEHHIKLIELLQVYFPTETVASRRLHQENISTMTVGELWKGKERLIIFYQDQDTCNDYPDYVWSNNGSTEEDISDVEGFIYRPFSPGVRDVHQLSEFMVKTLQKRKGTEKFYVLPATLFWNQWNVVWGFVCGNKGCWGLTFPTSHRQFNEGYAHMIHEQVSDMLLKERKRVNIVMMDWITESYNKLLIIQNLRQVPLKDQLNPE